jgi:hypothetical protein
MAELKQWRKGIRMALYDAIDLGEYLFSSMICKNYSNSLVLGQWSRSAYDLLFGHVCRRIGMCFWRKRVCCPYCIVVLNFETPPEELKTL